MCCLWCEPSASWAADSNILSSAAAPHSGIFKDERITLEFAPPASRVAGEVTGSIRLGDQTFPFTAKASPQSGVLNGTFESQGDRFGFSASLDGQMLIFTTEGTTYRLKKQSTNPLVRPASPNPLVEPAKGRVTDTAPPPSSGGTGTIYLLGQSINDDDAMIGGEAFRILIPAGWKIEGGIRWRLHPVLPAYLGLRVTNPNGLDTLEVLPTYPFVWVAAGMPSYPAGSFYLGNEVRETIEDPVDFIKRIVIPRLRPNIAKFKVVSSEELPKVAEAIAAVNQEKGLLKTFKAARVRLEYAQMDKTVQEDIYCVLGLAYAPAINTMFWGAERNYSFKAEKGKLDEQSKTFQTMMASLQPNLQWFNRYVQLVQILIQNQLEQTRSVAELSRYITRTSSEINDIRRQAFENSQAAHDRISSEFSRYVRGVQEYNHPQENRPVGLPDGYRDAWTNPAGDYIVSNDLNFNPNIGASTDWRRMEKKK
jgi:hypothetical protein